MNFLFLAFLLIVLVPLLAASWRVSLLGLSLQGFLLGGIALSTHHDLSLSTALALVDFVVIRGILAPQILYRVLATHHAPRRSDDIPSNLFSWVLACGFVFVSFRFASEATKADLASSMHLATVTAAFLLGMFVLSTRNSMFHQIVGLLRIENALGLFELMLSRHLPLVLQIGMSSAFLLTVLLLGRFLRGEYQYEPVSQPPVERPTL